MPFSRAIASGVVSKSVAIAPSAFPPSTTYSSIAAQANNCSTGSPDTGAIDAAAGSGSGSPGASGAAAAGDAPSASGTAAAATRAGASVDVTSDRGPGGGVVAVPAHCHHGRDRRRDHHHKDGHRRRAERADLTPGEELPDGSRRGGRALRFPAKDGAVGVGAPGAIRGLVLYLHRRRLATGAADVVRARVAGGGGRVAPQGQMRTDRLGRPIRPLRRRPPLFGERLLVAMYYHLDGRSLPRSPPNAPRGTTASQEPMPFKRGSSSPFPPFCRSPSSGAIAIPPGSISRQRR